MCMLNIRSSGQFPEGKNGQPINGTLRICIEIIIITFCCTCQIEEGTDANCCKNIVNVCHSKVDV